MLTKEISEVEKGCGRLMGFPADKPRIRCGNKNLPKPSLIS